jgi:hypothetical protein
VFPYSKDTPSECTQVARTTAIPAAITYDFLLPVGSVILGQPITSWTAMPKAAVKKDGKPLGSKDKIRLAG